MSNLELLEVGRKPEKSQNLNICAQHTLLNYLNSPYIVIYVLLDIEKTVSLPSL
jgi:hypothetical protein